MDSAERDRILAADPGNPIFADYAEELRVQGKHVEAQQVALKGLSHNPSCHLGRLALARCFYDLSLLPFARREIAELCRVLPKVASLKRLAEKLAVENYDRPVDDSAAEHEVLAEEEFDFGEIDLVAEDLKKSGQ